MNWQKKLRYRGFRLLGFSLPLLMLSLVAASFIPRRAPQTLAAGEVSALQKISGRLSIPATAEADVAVTLALQWEQRPPPAMRFDIQVSDAAGLDQIRKKIKVKAQQGAQGWQQLLEFRLPPQSIRTFSLVSSPREAIPTRFSFQAFASSPTLRLLRIGEMLFYPALVFVLLALVMVIFPGLGPG